MELSNWFKRFKKDITQLPPENRLFSFQDVVRIM